MVSCYSRDSAALRFVGSAACRALFINLLLPPRSCVLRVLLLPRPTRSASRAAVGCTPSAVRQRWVDSRHP